MRAPRKQALRLTEWLTRERPSLRAVLLGGRREGKSDLLAQIHASLFERAEGPLPFLFRFAAPAASLSTSHDRQQATSHDRQQALRFAASFCQQMRAFLLRQEEVLGEPPGELAMEMDRPGLPLSLAELCRELLIAPTDSSGDATVLALVSRLPARFAHREGRPVCNLWDDCHTLAPDHPFFGALEAGPGLHIDLNQDLSKDLNRESATVCSLLTGFEPPMRRLAGARAWTALPLDPFASSEALLLAESCCKASGLRFSREVWETWFAVAGTSPGWAAPLIESAALRGEPIESLEQLARIYSDELNGGSLGQWLEVRWPLPAPAAVAHQAPQTVAENLQRGEAAALSADEVASPTDSSAPAEERGGGAQAAQRLNHGQWLRQRPFSLESTLGAVERDWLRLELNRAKIGSGRARARLIQEFLLRATRALSGQQASEETPRSTLLEVIEERLGLPIAPLLVAARVVAPSGDELLLPQIFSVAREPVASAECAAELFWCYGARPGARPAHRQSEPRGQRTAKKAPTSAPT